jgi:transcriptional regulator with XRE-family HTH domain
MTTNEPQENRIGRRIRSVRLWRRMTLTATAGLAGFSPSHLSMIERGLRRVDRRSTLEALAAALRVSPADLTGQPYAPAGFGESLGHAAAQEMRAVLRDIEIGALDDLASSRHHEELTRDVAAATAACSGSDYGRLGEMVPGLLVETYLYAGRVRTTESRVLLASVLHSAFYLAKDLGHGDLAWMVAGHLQVACETVADPAWAALADFVRAHAVLGPGARERGLRLAEHGTDLLAPDRGDAGQMFGMLNLSAALNSAATGRHDRALEHLDEAALMARETGEGNFAGLMFGEQNVRIWRVAVALESGEGGRVPELAKQVDVDSIPSAGRRATFYCDVGRGFSMLRGREAEAVAAFSRAEELAPQRMRTNPYVRESVSELLSRGSISGNRDLRGMAYRLGLAG